MYFATRHAICFAALSTEAPPNSLVSLFAIASHLPWKHPYMYFATGHAICSAALSTEATATFMFLPSWNSS